MNHFELLTYCCQQAEKDLQTGYGIGYNSAPINVQVQCFPNAEEPGFYQVLAKANNRVSGVLIGPSDEFLGNLLNGPERVESYISIIRNNAWKWAHSDDARSLALAANQEPAPGG